MSADEIAANIKRIEAAIQAADDLKEAEADKLRATMFAARDAKNALVDELNNDIANLRLELQVKSPGGDRWNGEPTAPPTAKADDKDDKDDKEDKDEV